MRPEVIAFGQRMEKELVEATEQKGEDSWKTSPSARPLLTEVRYKLAALTEAVEAYEKALARRVPRQNVGESQEKVFKLAADIGNYAMMAADVCGSIPLAQPSPTDISNLRMMAVLRTARAHLHDGTGLLPSNEEAIEMEAFLQEIDDVLSHKPVALKSAARAILELLEEDELQEVLNELDTDDSEPDSPALTDRDDDDND